MTKKKIVITGASGFVGSHLCRYLADKGHDVIPIYGPNQKLKPGLDLSDKSAVKRIFESKPDWILHFAAALPSTFYADEAIQTKAINTKMDQNIIEMCADHKVGLIFASTTSVYGKPDGTLKSETSPLSPLGPYAEGKKESENLIQSVFRKKSEVPFKIFRLSSPYGPKPNPKGVMGIFLKNAKENNPLFYHGQGTREQDFIFIDDLCEGVELSLSNKKSDLYNLASGQSISMKKLAELVVHATPGCKSAIKPSGKPDPQENWKFHFDVTKAKNGFGWVPRTSLEKGIKASL